jgi:hypothetical protein
MSDPSKCMTLLSTTDVRVADTAPLLTETGNAKGRRQAGDKTVRMIENWIVAVVTLLSAGVILLTLLAHRDLRPSSGPETHATFEAGALGQ